MCILAQCQQLVKFNNTRYHIAQTNEDGELLFDHYSIHRKTCHSYMHSMDLLVKLYQTHVKRNCELKLSTTLCNIGRDAVTQCTYLRNCEYRGVKVSHGEDYRSVIMQSEKKDYLA